ncbi:hypothetical protein R4B61_01830 [Fructilactobacillus vespulae]|uniref:hypothetical protein n=1 Tax=Fructilactobacillus vespulae TaxID=1249630 RepID=UPI0039B3CCFC
MKKIGMLLGLLLLSIGLVSCGKSDQKAFTNNLDNFYQAKAVKVDINSNDYGISLTQNKDNQALMASVTSQGKKSNMVSDGKTSYIEATGIVENYGQNISDEAKAKLKGKYIKSDEATQAIQKQNLNILANFAKSKDQLNKAIENSKVTKEKDGYLKVDVKVNDKDTNLKNLFASYGNNAKTLSLLSKGNRLVIEVKGDENKTQKINMEAFDTDKKEIKLPDSQNVITMDQLMQAVR